MRSVVRLIGWVPDCVIAMCPAWAAVTLFQLKLWAQIHGG
jgi:hypothetical protein